MGRCRSKDQISFDIETQTKVCRICGERRDFRYFKVRTLNTDGREGACKYCLSNAPKMKMRFANQVEDDIISQTKVCSKCGDRKTFDEFSIMDTVRDGRASRCKECQAKARISIRDRMRTLQRVSTILFKFGINEESLTNLMNDQRGCCAICENSLVNPHSKQTFHIDHNHETGEIRGLLCRDCNILLGQAKDSPNILRRGAEYLLEKGYCGKD